VTPAQAAQVIDLAAGRPAVIALDGDEAGAEGTARWLDRVCLRRHTLALTTRLPTGLDPADWIRAHGTKGLTAFDRERGSASPGSVVPVVPGRELARIVLSAGGGHIKRPAETILPLVAALPAQYAAQLLGQVEREVTRQGWNPNGIFTADLRNAISAAGLAWHAELETARVAGGGSVSRPGAVAVPLLA